MGISRYLFFIGLRYFVVKRKDHFVSFISLVSMIGIALGVAVLITVLSIMNGFSKEIRSKILSITPHITLRNFYGALEDWQPIVNKLKQYKEIIGIAPYIAQHGLLTGNGFNKPVVVIGIDPLQIANVYPLKNNIIQGELSELISGKFNMIVGRDLIDHFAINTNEQVVLTIPQLNISPMGVAPRIKKFNVSGIFKSGTQYDYNHVFLDLSDASKLYKMQQGITGIQIKLNDELDSKKIAYQISKDFSYRYFISDWTQEFGAFFEAIKMEKMVMWCILLLIIAVAAFNLVSSLIMLVTDKRPDIAILRVMGSTNKDVMSIFMIQGSVIGLIGTIVGTIIGLILAYNVTDITSFIQNMFDIKFISEEVHLIGFVPSKINLKDILWVDGLSLLMSFLATVYPAWRAGNIKPAEALRYE